MKKSQLLSIVFSLIIFTGLSAVSFAESDYDDHDFEDEYKDSMKDERHDYDMREKMDAFCDMSDEDKTSHLEDHNKTEHMEMMEEYCSLDDDGRTAFIDEYKDSMKSEYKDSMKSEYKDSMKSEYKKKIILRASVLTDQQKEIIKDMHSDLRDLKHLLRDKSINATETQTIRDQFMEKAKEFAMTWISPRHQIAAGIAAEEVECREGHELVIKTSNGNPICVKDPTAEKLIKRGIAIPAI